MAVVGNVKGIQNTNDDTYLYEDEAGRRMMCDKFDATKSYAIGDICIYDNVLYKFKAAHTANTAWSASEVDAIQLADIIQKTSFNYDSENETLVIEQSTY